MGTEELRARREAGKKRGETEKAGGCPGGVAAGAGRGSEQEEMERETAARTAALGWSGAAV